jgi:tetratricopeptide (TPR) repeat protein
MGRLTNLSVLVCAAALTVSFAAPEPCHAQGKAADDARGRELYKEGDKAYAEGDYETAVAKFEEAYELSGRKALLFNIGNAHERLGNPKRAAEALREYLPHAKRADKPTLEKRVESLEKRAQAEEEAKAKAEAEREAEAKAQAEREAREREAAEKGSNQDPTGDAGAKSEPPILAYTLLGVGAVGIGAGAYFGLSALSARDDADAGCSEQGGSRICSSSAEDALDRDQRFSLFADIGFGVGLVAAGVGTYLLLTHDDKPTDTALSVGVGQTPHSTKVTLGGRF